VVVIASFFRDIVHGLSGWRRTPGSALLVVIALGLSGGALITLVSLCNALFWRELPVSHPETLVGVSATDPRAPGRERVGIPVSVFASLDRTENVFQGFAAFVELESIAVIQGTSRRMAIEGVSGRYFETLGLIPPLGRVLGAHDVDSASPVATISFHCWQTRFGADRNVIGQTFRLRGELVTVIGVAPRGFVGLEVGVPADAWVPASLAPRLLNQPPSLIFFEALVGRLRPGVTLQQAKPQLESLWPPARQSGAEVVAASLPEARDDMLALQPRIESAARGFSSSGYRFFYRPTLVLLVLSGAMTLVLSCANLSGLLLARWAAREVDLAVQAALGASNGRLVSQVVGESLALSMTAVTLSTPLAIWSAKSLTLLLWNNPDASSPLDLGPDYRVFGVMLLLVGIIALCMSLLPASRIWSGKLRLKRGTRGLPGRSVTRWGRWLAAAQVALSIPLLVTAWMVAANLYRLEGINTGFRAEGVVVANLTNQGGVTPAADSVAYLTQLASALRAAPGIAAAALSWNEPVSFSADRRRRPVTGSDGLRGVKPFVLTVSPGYFETLSVPLVAGRDFTWTDDRGQRDVGIISVGVASALFPGADPVGRSIRLGGPPDRLVEVIGVVGDAKLADPHAMNQLFLFTALLQEPQRLLEVQSPAVLLKSPLPPSALEALARRTIVALGRDDIFEAHLVQHTVDAALLRERVMRLGALYFAGLSTLLVFVGLFAVLNLGVARRVPEIGLRIALGASTYDIRVMVIREALVTAAAGLVVGLPCAFFSGRIIAATLTIIGSNELLAFGAAIALILTVTVLSLLVPLRRATHVTPVEALGTQ
jgi:predicted permease